MGVIQSQEYLAHLWHQIIGIYMLDHHHIKNKICWDKERRLAGGISTVHHTKWRIKEYMDPNKSEYCHLRTS